MTRKYVTQLVPLLEAYLRGETIQVKNFMPKIIPDRGKGWVDLPGWESGEEIFFALPLNNYRVKPTHPTIKRKQTTENNEADGKNNSQP